MHKQLKDSMIPYLTQKEIDEIVTRLAKEIEIDYVNKEIIFVCPLKGSFMFLADLCRKVSLDQQIEFVLLTTIGKHGSIRILKDIGQNISGRHVIIVEEVLDSGRSIQFLKNHLLASSPASVKVMTLLDKPARREITLKPDYVGMTIDDRYLVGYGMDSDETGRHYADIYYFKQ